MLKQAKAINASSKQQQLIQLQNTFNENLAKVYQAATHMKGVTECHRLMTENSDDRQYVRIFIGSLTDKSIMANNATNVTSMALHAAMFGYLAQKFQKNLIDSLDKAPNRNNTYKRIFKSLVSLFFTQPYDEVANGCATSMIEILE